MTWAFRQNFQIRPSPYLGDGGPTNFSIISTLGSLFSETIAHIYVKVWLESKKSYENSKFVDQKLSTGPYVRAKAEQSPLSDLLYLKYFGTLFFKKI